MGEAIRMEPLAGRLHGGNGATLTPAPAAERLSLRAATAQAGELGKALGLELPQKPGNSASNAGIAALGLGPDEWLIIADSGSDLSGKLAAVKAEPFSAVDISHRNTAIILEGPASERVLASGCPRNLSQTAFPQGACARTILAKAEIVLYREGAQRFRIECWRSFSDYVWKYLVDAAKSA